MDKEVDIQNKIVWNIGLLIFLSIAVNSDWKANSVLWWGSVAVFLVCFLVSNNMQIPNFFDEFIIWWGFFMFFVGLSAVYAYKAEAVFDALKTMIVLLIAFYMIRASVQTENDINWCILIYVFAVFICSVYLVTCVDVSAFVLERVGKAKTGNWNSNDVGIMMAISILFIIYSFKCFNSIKIHMFLLVVACLDIYLLGITASRKAVILVILGLSGYYTLLHPRKIVKNIFLTVLLLVASYWAIMKIPSLYELIGWRIEGMVASITGTGVVDSSAVKREMIRSDAKKVFLDNFITGCGYDNFKYYNTVMRAYAHNNYLEVAADLGIVGLVSYYWIYISIIIKYVKNRSQDPLFAILVTTFVLMIIMHYAMVATIDITQLLLICLGVSYNSIIYLDQEYLFSWQRPDDKKLL